MKFPNGKIRAKSKMSFTSDQAKMAQEIYDNSEDIQNFVDSCISLNRVPIFELCSPMNQIVLEYPDTKLVLLQIRTNDGYYVEPYPMKLEANEFNIVTSEDYQLLELDYFLKEKETAKGIEGWIITFEDGQMAKIKTNQYLQLHGLIGPDAFRENLLIQTILDQNIDDVISNLVPGLKKDKIIELTDLINTNFNHLVIEYKKLRGQYFNVYKENRKEFALKYSKTHPLFGAVMRKLNTSFRDVEKTAEEAVKEHMLIKTNTLGKAKDYVKLLEGERNEG